MPPIRLIYYILVLLMSVLTGAISLPSQAQGESQSTEPLAVLTIPSIQVSTTVERVYVRQFPDGVVTWDVEGLDHTVGLFDGLANPGERSNTVLGGHSEDRYGNPEIFFHLDQVPIGQRVILRTDDDVMQYRIIERFEVVATDLSVIYPTTDERLTLITCDMASFDATRRNYDQRVVVIAMREPRRIETQGDAARTR